MAVPVPRTYVASEFETATILNGDIRDVNNFQFEPPRVYAYRSSNFTLTNGSFVLISMAAELYDPYSPPGHDNTTNPSRVIAAETGLYQITAQFRTSDLSSTLAQCQVRKNAAGSSVGGTRVFLLSQNGAGGGQDTELGRTVDYPLNATDYVELWVGTSTGGAAATLIGGADATFLSIRWVTKQ